jgi:hypothetical protein
LRRNHIGGVLLERGSQRSSVGPPVIHIDREDADLHGGEDTTLSG